jgi:hypothetical protein
MIVFVILMMVQITNGLKKMNPLIDVWRSIEYLDSDNPSLDEVEKNNYSKNEWIR